MDTQRIEWHELEEGQRNCLMWPDFLLWDEPRTVEIQRKDPDSSLGLVTITVQDQETETYYNITKRIKENHPAHDSHVERFEWIFKVDGTKTTNSPSDEFSRLIKNGRKVVRLSLKKAVGPMSKFVKKWDAEKIVTLKLGKENDFQKRARLVHFYCQEENGNRKDRILVWEIKPGTDTETSETLHRGDELLAVDGELVEGKKLAEIYKLILCKVPAEVKLKIKEIQHNICNVEEMLTNSTVVENQVEIPYYSPDISMPEDKSPVFDDPKQSIIMQEDNNAVRGESEVHENISVLDEFEEESYPAVFETTVKPEADTIGSKKPITQETKKKPRRLSLISLGRRLSSKGSPSGNNKSPSDVTNEISNEGYKATPTSPRKFKMCSTCTSKDETQLSIDRDEWPIGKIENGCFHKICELLDLDYCSNQPLMSALDGFNQTTAACIKKKYETKGGVGTAEEALGKWGSSNHENNVRALKKILNNTMKRVDVVDEIKKWEKLPVCHGCGIRLHKSHSFQ